MRAMTVTPPTVPPTTNPTMLCLRGMGSVDAGDEELGDGTVMPDIEVFLGILERVERVKMTCAEHESFPKLTLKLWAQIRHRPHHLNKDKAQQVKTVRC
jgi:hypothetical protein